MLLLLTFGTYIALFIIFYLKVIQQMLVSHLSLVYFRGKN